MIFTQSELENIYLESRIYNLSDPHPDIGVFADIIVFFHLNSSVTMNDVINCLQYYINEWVLNCSLDLHQFHRYKYSLKAKIELYSYIPVLPVLNMQT